MNNLYYSDSLYGSETFVFLHLFGGSSNTWLPVITLLRDKYRCVAIDTPGFGNSKALYETQTVENTAHAISDQIKTITDKPVTIIGHSMGGKLATFIASERLIPLHRLILVAPSPPVPEAMNASKKQEMKALYGNRPLLEKYLKKLLIKKIDQMEFETLVNDHLKSTHQAWDDWIETGSQQNISSRTNIRELPFTLIIAQKDENFPGKFLKDTFSSFHPDFSFTNIPNAGHLLLLEQADAVASAILL